MPHREGGATAPFVGRVAELAACERALDHLVNGGFRLIEVVGDPGVGKTRLLAEIALRARPRGIAVARTQAAEYERDVPFASIGGVVAGAIARLSLDDLPVADRRVLASLFPALGPDIDGVAPRYRVHAALLKLLAGLGAERPQVVLLDDVHWIDEATTEFLGRLLRHPPDVPVLGVLAYRLRQAPPAFIATLRDYAGSRLTTVNLGPLSLAESAELLGLAPDAEKLAVLHRESHGNPFYLDILARHANGALPPDVRAGLLAELSGLSPDARRIIDAAAVTGEPFDTGLVARVAGQSEDAALGALDELAARDLIHSETGTSLRFRHELVRQAVYDELSLGQRTRAHREAASALAARGAPPGVTARHIAAYALPGDPAAIAALRQAGDDALGTAPATAAHWFDAALRLLPHGAPERVELLSALAMAYGVSGRLREGRDALHKVLALLPTWGGEARTQAVAFCATLERLLGRHVEARAILLAELDRMSGDSAEAFLILLELGSGALMRGEDGTLWAEQARAMARRLRQPHLEAAAVALRLQTLCTRGELRSALDRLPEAVILVDGLPDQRLAQRLDAAEWLGWSEILLGNPREASRHLVRGRDLAQTSGQSYRLPHLVIALANARGWQGELTEALALADEARELAILLASEELLWIVAMIRSLVSSWRGEHEDAVLAAGEAVRAGQKVDGGWGSIARVTEAFARLGIDRSVRAADELAEACAAIADRPGHEIGQLLWYEALCEGYARRGRPDAAAAWASRAAATGCAAIPAHQGLMLLAGAHARADPELARAAAEEFDRAGTRELAARARLRAGVLLGDSDRDRALALLAKATGVFAACGALGRHDEAMLAQRRLGARLPRVRGAAAGSAASLSTRELQVARLVARGLTNRDIARRLFISPRTVETHLAHAYAKLGVHSRAELTVRLTARLMEW